MKRIKRHKHKFLEVVSEMNPHKDIIEEIMALENEQERLVNSIHYYRFSPSICAGLSDFFDPKINDKELGVINAMKLQVEKNKRKLMKLLENYSTQVSSSIKIPQPEIEEFTTTEVGDYIEKADDIHSWDYRAFLKRDERKEDGTRKMSIEERDKQARSKIALEI